MTAAAIMGTTGWPFNIIHVRRDGSNISFIRQSSPTDRRYSTGKREKKKTDTGHVISNLTADAGPFDFTQMTQPEHMVSSAKHSTEDDIVKRGVE